MSQRKPKFSKPLNQSPITPPKKKKISKQNFPIRRDPIDALLLEQHMNAPFRFANDASLSQLVAQDAMAFVERAKQHLQMFGGGAGGGGGSSGSPYQDSSILPQLYQRPNIGNLNLGLWQGFWPQQIPPGFLAGIATQKNVVSPTQNSSAAASDLREKYFKRFSPYQIPQYPPSSGSPPN